MTRYRKRPEVAAALNLETTPGQCMVCDGKLRGTQRRLCGDEECARVYNTLYRMLARKAERAGEAL